MLRRPAMSVEDVSRATETPREEMVMPGMGGDGMDNPERASTFPLIFLCNLRMLPSECFDKRRLVDE